MGTTYCKQNKYQAHDIQYIKTRQNGNFESSKRKTTQYIPRIKLADDFSAGKGIPKD